MEVVKSALSLMNRAQRLKNACALLAAAAAALASPGVFTIAIGPPVAANVPQMKSAALAVRLENCNAANPSIAGTAEGIAGGERKSIPLKFVAAPRPNAYVVPRVWPEGKWVLSLNATCGDSKAGAVVPLGPRGFIREGSQYFTHAPTNAEVETALKNAEGVAALPLVNALIAHEWGTFTSVAGLDGNPVEWAPLSGPPDLPCFVERLGSGFVKYRPGMVRMETPVLFFYAPQAMTLSVHVDFPKGWMTEYYPAPTAVEPKRPVGRKTGSIEWNNLQIEPDSDPALPKTRGESRYYAARNTDAAPLEIGGQHEKMLFYRGVGDFYVPVLPRYLPNGKLEIHNTGRPIPLALLFENHDGKAGYQRIGRIQGNIEVDPRNLQENLDRLKQDLIGDLVEFGLYRKEAIAMLDTWQDSWFEEGSRIIAIEPREQVDEWLPTKISPQPAEMVRVFVGRIEMLSPGTRATIERAATAGDSQTLKKFGRFLGVYASEMDAWNMRGVRYVAADLNRESLGTCVH